MLNSRTKNYIELARNHADKVNAFVAQNAHEMDEQDHLDAANMNALVAIMELLAAPTGYGE